MLIYNIINKITHIYNLPNRIFFAYIWQIIYYYNLPNVYIKSAFWQKII
jgi:hypothetical protein